MEFIAQSSVASQLFAGTSQFDLLLFKTEDFLKADGFLQISYRPQIHQIKFHYVDFGGLDEDKDLFGDGGFEERCGSSQG